MTKTTVNSSDIRDGTITDADIATANKDGASGTASLRTLGTGAAQAAAGNDARLAEAATHVADTSAAHAASSVAFTPNGSIAATDVQAAIQEVRDEAGGTHPDLATHDALGLATDAELAAHVGDTSAAHAASAIGFTPNGSIAATDVQAAIQEVRDEAAGGGAPSTADYLVGTADGGLSNEIAVGTTPGGELGGTWASPTVDATHAGSTHVSIAGPTPRALPLSHDPSAAYTTAVALVANGGSIAIAMYVPAAMNLEAVRVRNTDTSLPRAWRWDLYKQNGATNVLDRVAASNGSEAFTAGAASVRTLAAASAPVVLAPGVYWLVLQSTHATNTFGVGSTAPAALATAAAQTKTTTNPNGATLDFTAATWTKVIASYAVVMDGRVFGQSTAF